MIPELRKFFEFDEDGMSLQSKARTREVVEAMIECVKALKEYEDEPIHYIKDAAADFDDEEIEEVTVAANALANLRAKLEDGK